MKVSKQLFFLFLGFFICIGSGMRLWAAWQQNQLAIVAIDHLTLTTNCVVNEARLQWQGDTPNSPLPPYLQAVVASALNTKTLPPTSEKWERNPRLYNWFMAQTAVKNKAYSNSLFYLSAADAGALIDAAGYTNTSPTCRIINWTIASEIGYREPPDSFVQAIRDTGQWWAIEQAFTHLLKYDAQRMAWRLALAESHIIMGEISMAEEILAPVFLYGTVDEIQAAETLLQSTKPE